MITKDDNLTFKNYLQKIDIIKEYGKLGRHELENGNYYIVSNTHVTFYSKDNYLHREDGPAFINEFGQKMWYKHGYQHREDGPSVEHSDGGCEWHQNGKLHRKDGPAIDPIPGEITNKTLYFYAGKPVTKEEFKKFKNSKNAISANDLTHI